MSTQFPPPPQFPAPPVATAYGGPSGPRANFGRRLVAYIIDIVLGGILIAILYALLKGVGDLIGAVIWIGYFSYFEGGPSGQTLGKKAMGIRVYDFTQGGPIGFGRGIGRTFARILSAIPCYLGYFWMLWDGEKQCWHDKLATTIVVPVSAYPVQN